MADSSRSWRDRALVQLVLVRFREFLREPEALFWTFAFPILMAAGLGIAFKDRPADAYQVAVLSSAPPGTAATIAADPRFVSRALDDSAAARALRIGRVALVVATAPDGAVEYRFDDTRPEGRAARAAVDDALQRGAGRADPMAIRDVVSREPGSRYIDFLIPGLLGMNIMASGIWGIGFTIVDTRRKRLLKRLVATPMRRSHYLASFIIARLSLLILEAGVLITFGLVAFDLPFRGSVGTFALTCVLSSLAFGGLGLLIAARPRTIEGASGLMNFAMLPMWVFSGVFFSSSNFPDAMQPFIQALPLTAANDALRATLLEGATLVQVAPELGILAAWLAGAFALALRIFRWQ